MSPGTPAPGATSWKLKQKRDKLRQLIGWQKDMDFEWDSDKVKRNLANHNVGFEEAKTAFQDPLFVTFEDPSHSIAEHRFLLLAQSSQGRLLVVAYTERGDTTRLISARKATKRERNAYEENI